MGIYAKTTSTPRSSLLSLGTAIGKFTKSGKFRFVILCRPRNEALICFRIQLTALDVIAPHARYKVWIKQNGVMPFLYGSNVAKAHVGRFSEDCPENAGVIVMDMNDTPLVSGILIRRRVKG